jgi:plasmid stability protein
LDGAGRAYWPPSFVKSQAGIVPFKPAVGNNTTRLPFQVVDQLLVIHLQHDAFGENRSPVAIICDIVISFVDLQRELTVAQFIVRHLEEDVKARLKRRAARHGRSMEEEVRHILRGAVKDENQRVAKLGSRIAARFAKSGLTTELPELHDQRPRSTEFRN